MKTTLRASLVLGMTLLAASASASSTIVRLPGKTARGGEVCAVRLEKIGPNEIKVGSFFDYFIRVENLSECDIDGIRLRDFAPERVQYEAADPEPRDIDEDGSFLEEVTWREFDLDPEEIRIFHLRVHVVGEPNRTLRNRACLRIDDEAEIFPDRCVEKRTEVVTGGPEI